MAQMAADEGIEMIMTVGHRKGWDAGSKEISTSEGAMQGFRLRGSDNISYHIADIMRNIEAGHRGFLVYDEGVLFLLNRMRSEGLVPAETIFKFSVFGGYCSAAGAKVIESMGANSMNPISDVSLPILGGIRKVASIPLPTIRAPYYFKVTWIPRQSACATIFEKYGNTAEPSATDVSPISR